MRVHRILPRTCANGPGWRSALWLQGCTLACPGCFNPETWVRDGDDLSVSEVFLALTREKGLEGVSISGGEPLQQAGPLLELVKRLRAETSLSIVLFTGYPWPVVQRHAQLLACLDVVLAGPYDRTQHVGTGLLGSANKTIHLLTDRYRLDDLQGVPGGEVIITEEGDLVFTGIDPVR